MQDQRLLALRGQALLPSLWLRLMLQVLLLLLRKQTSRWCVQLGLLHKLQVALLLLLLSPRHLLRRRPLAQRCGSH
jgi:hypothetical protein